MGEISLRTSFMLQTSWTVVIGDVLPLWSLSSTRRRPSIVWTRVALMPSSRHVALIPDGEVGSPASSTLAERPFYLTGSLVQLPSMASTRGSYLSLSTYYHGERFAMHDHVHTGSTPPNWPVSPLSCSVTPPGPNSSDPFYTLNEPHLPPAHLRFSPRFT